MQREKTGFPFSKNPVSDVQCISLPEYIDDGNHEKRKTEPVLYYMMDVRGAPSALVLTDL